MPDAHLDEPVEATAASGANFHSRSGSVEMGQQDYVLHTRTLTTSSDREQIPQMHGPDAIRREWFSDPDRWWRKDPAFDEYLRATYQDDVEAALRGERDGWAETPRGALALVILLDQFARNIYRDTPRMYAGDDKAVSTCLAVIDRGEDVSLSDDERQFLYMPLMHSEDRALQERSLEKFRELGQSFEFAVQHAKIVFRFGRFPHRNAILGRKSTPEEIDFLKQPGSSF